MHVFFNTEETKQLAMLSFQFVLIAVCLISIQSTNAGPLNRLLTGNEFKSNYIRDFGRRPMFDGKQSQNTNIGFPKDIDSEEIPEPYLDYNYLANLSSYVTKDTNRSKRNGPYKPSASERRSAAEESLRRALDKIYRDIEMPGLRVGRK